MNDSNSHFACSKELPALQYVTNIHSKNFRHILADGVPIYDVPNEVELYSALGYTKQINAEGVLPEEYVWRMYTADNAKHSKLCLQVKLFSYLYNKSDSFKSKYGNLYREVVGGCLSDKIDNHEDQCIECPLHPLFFYE